MTAQRKGDWIQTYTGKQFWPMDPRPEDFDFRDIAHHLSNICRFTGAVDEFYSVAQHSVLVAHRAAQLAAVVSDDAYVRMVTQWASVHDGPEAYILDMSRPVKALPEMAPYRSAEKAIMQALCIRLGLPEVMPPEVKQADMELCYTEARDLLGPKHPAWCWGALPLAEEIVPQSPRLARQSWQSLFETLFPEHAPTSWLREK